MQFYALEPFGDQRGDLRAAIIACTISNRLRGKNEAASQPIDFMPYHIKPQQTPEEIRSTLRAVLESHRG